MNTQTEESAQGDGLTPHDLDQIVDPVLPDRGQTAYVMIGGRHAVVCCVPRNVGTTDQPEYRDLYYVHTRKGVQRYSARQIMRWWDQVQRWDVSEKQKIHLGLAASEELAWSEALAAIDLLSDASDMAEVAA